MDRNTLPFDMEIPPLLLQPLAENAIYHGIQPREEGGTLGISLYDAGERLDIVITNPVLLKELIHTKRETILHKKTLKTA